MLAVGNTAVQLSARRVAKQGRAERNTSVFLEIEIGNYFPLPPLPPFLEVVVRVDCRQWRGGGRVGAISGSVCLAH